MKKNVTLKIYTILYDPVDEDKRIPQLRLRAWRKN